MNEEPHRPLEIFRRDRDHQLEWLEQHGTEVMDAVKLAYDSGLLSVVQGLDRAAFDNALQAVVESGVADRKKSDELSAVETPKETPLMEAEDQSNVVQPKPSRIHQKRRLRWNRILHDYLPKGLTQNEIADLEERDVETIKDDFADMRKKGLLSPYSHP